MHGEEEKVAGHEEADKAQSANKVVETKGGQLQEATRAEVKKEQRIGIEGRIDSIDSTKTQNIVEMADHKIAIVQDQVNNRVSQYKSCEASKTKTT